MKLAILMDPLKTLTPYKDSTLAMIESAQKMGWECVYFTLDDLFCQNGEPYAQVHDIVLFDLADTPWYASKSLGEHALSTFDIILVRKDPPVNMAYLYALNLLELAERSGVLVANQPRGLRDVNEKMITLQYPSLIPKTLVSANITQLKAFWAEHRNVIFKRLDGMGGQSVFHVSEDGRNLSVILDLLTVQQQQLIMAQRFIPEIYTEGDKRILLIAGKPVSHALARFPAPGESRGNLAAGGHGKVVPLTAHDKQICAQIAPMLEEKGLGFVGIDVIGQHLTEINVTSPTCIREVARETGEDIAGAYLHYLMTARLKLNKTSG